MQYNIVHEGCIATVLCICLFALSLFLFADEYYIQWADTVDNGYVDNAEDIAVDNSNNIIVTGYADMGGDYNYDYFTVKYDSNGTILWADTIDNGISIARSVAVDTSDNIIVTGYCIVGGYADYFTVKYDPNGIILWTDTIVNARHDNALGVTVDNANNIIVTGYSVMPGPNCDYFTVKYDPDGAILWQDVVDNRIYDYAFGVAVDNSDNIIVTGHSGDPYADYDYFTVKYDPNGTILWQDTLVGDVAYDVAVDNSNSIIVTGYCVNQGDKNCFTVKYDSKGTILWQDTIDNSINDAALGVVTDTSNNIIVTGYSELSDLDFFTVKYDPGGTILWQDTIDNVGDDFAHGVAVDNSDNIIVTGTFFINGNNDYMTVKYVPVTGVSENYDFLSAPIFCDIHPNPFSRLTTVSFGVEHSAKSIELRIFDVTGRLVKQYNYPTIQQSNQIRWDGTDHNDHKLASGVYLIMLETERNVIIDKVILVNAN